MSTASLQDRLDVIEVVNRFGWHTDQHEWDELSEVLAEDIYCDYSAVFGVEQSTVARADVLSQWEKLFSHVRTQHIITNHIVDVDDDTATCRAHFHANHVAEARHGDSQFLLAGSYQFGLARTDGRWRVASVVVSPIWSRGNLTILTG
ncbi:nuclear transport factor 2 family protein [Actinophytocola sp.]|uniref:nuclear transport factor 2 family protein n=1 Tax=Actinophytocola sp. TaxID=1872138 RepID=UPI002ED636FD